MIVYRIGQELNGGILAWMDNEMFFRREEHYPDFTDWFETPSLVRANRVAARWPFGTVEVIAIEYTAPEKPPVLEQTTLW